nr:uncharacterized protein LOC118033379 isoform X3 [Populus alba]
MIYTHNLRASLRLSVRKLVPAMAGVLFRLLQLEVRCMVMINFVRFLRTPKWNSRARRKTRMNISQMEERLWNSTIILDLEPTIVTLQDHHNLADVLIVSFSDI